MPEAESVDPNRELFQSRVQMMKVEICRKQWEGKWSWLLDERKRYEAEANAIRRKFASSLPMLVMPSKMEKEQDTKVKTLKPVPETTGGMVGWLANKPECALEIYSNWVTKIPSRSPDAWQSRDYFEPPTS